MAENISADDARYALEIVQTICRQVGPGLPGSPQERQRAALIAAELEHHLGTENVVVEEFSLAPGAFLGSLLVCALFTLIAALLNISLGRFDGLPLWASAGAALAFSCLSLILFLSEYNLYFELIDPFFKHERSVNVIGRLRRPGATSVKRLLILSGHHDSALENTWIGLLGYGFLITVPTLFIGFITLLAMSAFQLAGVISGNAGLARLGTLGWVLLIYPIAPAILFGLFFNRGRKNGGTVPGAADNLSACALALAMCRFLVQNPAYIPAETEIRFVTFGSEEAGLRGSSRYVTRHLDELRRLDARLLNYEVVAHPEIAIMTTDVRGVKNSPQMVRSLAAAAARAGVPYTVKPYPLGGGASDAGPFSQAGLKAATLMPFKMPQQIVAFYHQRRDTPEVLTLEPLFNVLKLTLEWVRSNGEDAKQP